MELFYFHLHTAEIHRISSDSQLKRPGQKFTNVTKWNMLPSLSHWGVELIFIRYVCMWNAPVFGLYKLPHSLPAPYLWRFLPPSFTMHLAFLLTIFILLFCSLFSSCFSAHYFQFDFLLTIFILLFCSLFSSCFSAHYFQMLKSRRFEASLGRIFGQVMSSSRNLGLMQIYLAPLT